MFKTTVIVKVEKKLEVDWSNIVRVEKFQLFIADNGALYPLSFEDSVYLFKTEIAYLLRKDRKIRAIRLYREFMGQGLREAKENLDILAHFLCLGETNNG